MAIEAADGVTSVHPTSLGAATEEVEDITDSRAAIC
jgi:hypothetical protein